MGAKSFFSVGMSLLNNSIPRLAAAPESHSSWIPSSSKEAAPVTADSVGNGTHNKSIKMTPLAPRSNFNPEESQLDADGVVSVHNNDVYRKKRLLPDPYINWLGLWGFIVGCIINGEYFCFTTGLVYGFGTMIVAHVIVTILACCVSLSLTELATAFPFSSSFVTYANAAFGGGVASFVGYAYTIEILILQTVPTLAIAQIVSEIFGANSTLQPFIWIVTIIFAMLLNYKPAILIKTSIAFSAISVLILIICFSITGSHILFNEAFSVSSNANFTSSITSLEPPSNFLPFGIQGVIEAIPYALYLVICYEAIQALPEEIIHPNTDIKIGMFVAIPCTVMPLSWIALMLFSSLPPGIQDIEVAFLPLTDAFTSIFGMNIESGKLFHLLSLPSILVAQSCIFMASTRFIYGLSRGGFLPSSISLTTSRGNPHVAITINAFGSLIICAVQLFGGVETSTIFIKIGTTFALIAYCADSLIFIRLRYKMPTLPRPFASPLGVAGGYIASAISIFTLGGLVYLDIVFRYSFLAACLFFVFCIPIYFYIIKRNLKENLFIKHQLEKRLDQKLRDRHESESGSDKKTPSLVKDTSASSRRFSRVLQSPKNMGPIFPRASTSYNANRFSIVAQAAAAIDQDSLPIHARIQGNAVTCVQASENQPNDSDFIRVDVG